MRVYRIARQEFSNLFGKGAELFGGRWNVVGTPALYTSEHRSLCLLEILVHTPKHIVPPKFNLIEINIPKKQEQDLLRLELSNKDWNTLKVKKWTQELGSKYFADSQILGITVPSTIIEEENNIILNPKYKKYSSIKIVGKKAFELDDRLLI